MLETWLSSQELVHFIVILQNLIKLQRILLRHPVSARISYNVKQGKFNICTIETFHHWGERAPPVAGPIWKLWILWPLRKTQKYTWHTQQWTNLHTSYPSVEALAWAKSLASVQRHLSHLLNLQFLSDLHWFRNWRETEGPGSSFLERSLGVFDCSAELCRAEAWDI